MARCSDQKDFMDALATLLEVKDETYFPIEGKQELVKAALPLLKQVNSKIEWAEMANDIGGKYDVSAEMAKVLRVEGARASVACFVTGRNA